MSVYRIWAVPVPDATPLAGRAWRWRVVNCYLDSLGGKDRALCVKGIGTSKQQFDRVLAFDASRPIRVGAFVNPKRELFKEAHL